jgi:hypothetical protein
VKGILSHNLDLEGQLIPVQLPPARTFSRQANELVGGSLVEVATWN